MESLSLGVRAMLVRLLSPGVGRINLRAMTLPGIRLANRMGRLARNLKWNRLDASWASLDLPLIKLMSPFIGELEETSGV